MFVEPAGHGIAKACRVQGVMLKRLNMFQEGIRSLIVVSLMGGKVGDFVVPYQVFFAGEVKVEVALDLLEQGGHAKFGRFPLDPVEERVEVIMLGIHFRDAEARSWTGIVHSGHHRKPHP